MTTETSETRLSGPAIASEHCQHTPEQFQLEANFCTRHGLQLEPAAGYGWNVRSANSDQFGHVIGCIEHLQDCVELLRLDGGFHWSTYPGLHDALVNLTAQPPRYRRGRARG